MIPVLFGIATLLYRTATATFKILCTIADWHFHAAERLYLADIERRKRRDS